MIETRAKNSLPLPLKSVAGALLFSVILGPVGTLYASVLGGVILIFLTFTAISGKFYVAAITFWLISCVVSVAAVNRYNRKMVRLAVE